MTKARLLLMSLTAALSLGALFASAASAVNFEWKVNGAALAAAQTREFTASADSPFDLSGSVAGVAALLLSSKLEVLKGAKIIGGKPGTNEETVIFKNVVVDKPAKCVVQSLGLPSGTVQTNLLETEIVEGQDIHGGTGEPLILFTPKKAGAFVTLLFLNKGTEECAFNNVQANITGSLLALPLPIRTEVVTGDWDFEAITKKYLLSPGGSKVEEAGLSLGGNATTLTGLALVSLTTGEKFGAF